MDLLNQHVNWSKQYAIEDPDERQLDLSAQFIEPRLDDLHSELAVIREYVDRKHQEMMIK